MPALATLVQRLHLSFTSGDHARITNSLSAVEQIGDHLWLGCDQTATVELLTRTSDGDFAGQVSLALADYFKLPGKRMGEVDLEGMAVDRERNRLWLIGSHSRTRRAVSAGMTADEARAALSDISYHPNRYLLGFIQLSDQDGQPVVPKNPRRQAMDFGKKSNWLYRMLATDSLLSPFLKLPSKDNGLDIEGLAFHDGSLFLGLRGPVLRGQASILQVRPVAGDGEFLVPKPFKASGSGYLHHLIDLDGLGIRDLCVDGADLLILAGPTMSLEGPFRLYRWRDALPSDRARAVGSGELVLVFEFSEGGSGDHPEGIALFDRPGKPKGLIVVYDNPAHERTDGRSFVADLFEIAEPAAVQQQSR